MESFSLWEVKMKWYAVFVESKSETLVTLIMKKYFESSDLKCLVPLRKIPERKAGTLIDVIKPLFPGYIFIYTNMNPDKYYSIKKFPKVYRLLRRGKYNRTELSSYYTEVEEKEIESILNLVGNNGIIEYSQAIITGDKIIVTSGPLKGREEMIKKIDKRKKRAKIKMDLLGTEKHIDVGINIAKINND